MLRASGIRLAEPGMSSTLTAGGLRSKIAFIILLVQTMEPDQDGPVLIFSGKVKIFSVKKPLRFSDFFGKIVLL